MISVFAAVFGAGIFYQQVRGIKDKVDKIESKLEDLNKRVITIEKQIS